MRPASLFGIGLLFLLGLSAAATEEPPSRGGTIHGSIRTTSGEVVRGSIRWSSSRFWDDRLEAREVAPEEVKPEGYRFNLFGWTLFDSGDAGRIVHRVAVPFGHLSAVEPTRGGGAVLELKDGSRISVESDGGDVGSDLDLVVGPPGQNEVELPWRRIVRVEFSSGPRAPVEAERLFGTVKTRTTELSGFLEWDRDEATASEILNGEEEGRERNFPLSEVAAIEPAGSARARVVLRSGTVVTLGGTNDVNGDNRGTVVRLAGLATVVVPWDELVRVDFRPAPSSPAYEVFDGGRRIEGVVRSIDGSVRRGRIRWDQDECFSWETLDGEQDGLTYQIPFHSIRSIARVEEGGADVVLRDGRKLHLDGSNDVDEGHRGVAIEQDGGVMTILSWDELRDVELF